MLYSTVEAGFGEPDNDANRHIGKSGVVTRIGDYYDGYRLNYGWGANSLGTILFAPCEHTFIPVECFIPKYYNNF